MNESVNDLSKPSATNSATASSTPSATAERPKGVVVKRVMGQVRAEEAGPSLVVVAGIHGNEPAGVEAGRRVLARLAQGDVGLRGELVILGGNVAALRTGARYLKRDLNRGWSDADALRLHHAAAGTLEGEDQEQAELLAAIEAARLRARGVVHLADLHTSSAPGVPFVIFGDTLAQRRFVRVFPIPVIIGLVEHVDGVLSEFFGQRGLITFSVEGGQHEDPLSADGLEAILWLSLAHAGMFTSKEPAEVARAQALLNDRRGGLPRVLDVVSRHSITPDDEFVMQPGFRNVHRIAKGELLARDRRGEIRSDGDGVVVLPLYQKLGSDGFFWATEVSTLQLRLAELLRRLHFDALATVMPGVSRDASNPRKLKVSVRRGRAPLLSALRLLGYRRETKNGTTSTVERAE